MKLFGYQFGKESPKQEHFEVQTPSYKEMIIELSKIEIPTIKENPRRGWVEYGDDNLYPYKLNEYLDGSALHNAIVINKSKLIAGDDFMVDGKLMGEWGLEAELQQEIILKSFIKNAFSDYTWKDIKRMISLDWTISGNFCLEILWSVDFKKIAGVNYIPWTKIRPAIKNENGDITHYYYKEDWSVRTGEIYKIDSYDPNSHQPEGIDPEESLYNHNQLLYVRNYWPGQEYFGRPCYFGALTDIKSSEMISKWNLNSLDNGFTPSVIIKFPVKPQSKEEADTIIRNIRDQFSPRKAMQKIAVLFSNGKEQEPTVEPITVENIDVQMQLLKEQVENSIVAGHMVPSKELVGLPGSSGFAPADLELAWNIFYNTAIIDEKSVIEETFNNLIKINGFEGNVEFLTRSPIIKKI